MCMSHMHTNVWVYVCVRACSFVCLCVFMCVCVYVVNVCMCVHVCVWVCLSCDIPACARARVRTSVSDRERVREVLCAYATLRM